MIIIIVLKEKTLLFQQMMGVFATGRKAQNYYHYLSMTNSCYFDLLTTNTQVLVLLIKTKPTSLHHCLHWTWIGIIFDI